VENQILCCDAMEGLRQIPDESVSLVFTSIPYNVRSKYGNNSQGKPIDDDRPWAQYLAWLKTIFLEWKRILRKGGRAVINCDSIRTRDSDDRGRYFKRPIVKDIDILMDEVGLLYFDDIAWVKKNVRNNKCQWGTHRSPQQPILRREAEYLLVFCKDQWELPCITGQESDMTSEEFATLTSNVWHVPAETRPYCPHPCAFSEPLAYGVIKLFSWPGRHAADGDWVVDCFSGTGTTCAMAARLGRKFTGIDASPNFCRAARERVGKELKTRKAEGQSVTAA